MKENETKRMIKIMQQTQILPIIITPITPVISIKPIITIIRIQIKNYNEILQLMKRMMQTNLSTKRRK